MRIYVGNMSFSMDEEQLKTLFEQFGKVESANVVKDRQTGRHRGFGFVEMADNTEAQKAIEALNETESSGRNLKVNEARPRENRPNRRGPGGGGGGYDDM